MNDERIEQLLRKAPRSPAPAGLLEQLRTDIALPRRIETRPVHPVKAMPWFRRWFPAISFAIVFLACIVAIAVQTNQIAGLKHENATLQTLAQNFDPLRRDNSEYQRLKSEHEQLERLRRDYAELQQLREEVAQLSPQIQEMEKLRAENQKLLAANRQRGQTDDFFARNDNALENARAKAESAACINNLKQIGLAARIWANDNNDVFPSNWLMMTNELSTPKILACPSDKGRSRAIDWRQFSAGNVSYEFLNPNGTDAQPDVVLARCPIHNHVCLSDGSVQQLRNNQRIVQNANDKNYYIIDSPQPALEAEASARQRTGLPPGGAQPPPNPGVQPKLNEDLLRRYGLMPTNAPHRAITNSYE